MKYNIGQKQNAAWGREALKPSSQYRKSTVTGAGTAEQEGSYGSTEGHQTQPGTGQAGGNLEQERVWRKSS